MRHLMRAGACVAVIAAMSCGARAADIVLATPHSRPRRAVDRLLRRLSRCQRLGEQHLAQRLGCNLGQPALCPTLHPVHRLGFGQRRGRRRTARLQLSDRTVGARRRSRAERGRHQLQHAVRAGAVFLQRQRRRAGNGDRPGRLRVRPVPGLRQGGRRRASTCTTT